MKTSEEENSYELSELPRDMKRMLKIQLKELIYLVEDGELYEAVSSPNQFAIKSLTLNSVNLRRNAA